MLREDKSVHLSSALVKVLSVEESSLSSQTSFKLNEGSHRVLFSRVDCYQLNIPYCSIFDFFFFTESGWDNVTVNCSSYANITGDHHCNFQNQAISEEIQLIMAFLRYSPLSVFSESCESCLLSLYFSR